ncbi:MAG: hypothetical protein ACRDY4_03435, partial [Acidimicrobiia bacterium]
MQSTSTRVRLGVVLAVVAAICAALGPATAGTRGGSGKPDREVTWIKGYEAPGTPEDLNRVGVIKVGPEKAENVLVLVPGTSAGSGY